MFLSFWVDASDFNVDDFSRQYYESAVMKASVTESIKTVVD